MDKQRLQELAGISAEYLKNAPEEELTNPENFIELEEALEPDNGKEFSQTDWDTHIGHIVDIILHMAKADSDSEDDFVDNVEQYSADAAKDIKAAIAKRVKG